MRLPDGSNMWLHMASYGCLMIRLGRFRDHSGEAIWGSLGRQPLAFGRNIYHQL
jgi:hypothetical protein